MKSRAIFLKITAATSMFTLMGLLVAFKSGAFDNYIAQQGIDSQADSTKRDTLLLKDYIILSDSTFVVPAYVYSSKAMIMSYTLEFDTVYHDTILYGTPKAQAILSKKMTVTPSKGMNNSNRPHMNSTKSAPVIDPKRVNWDGDSTANKNRK